MAFVRGSTLRFARPSHRSDDENDIETTVADRGAGGAAGGAGRRADRDLHDRQRQHRKDLPGADVRRAGEDHRRAPGTAPVPGGRRSPALRADGRRRRSARPGGPAARQPGAPVRPGRAADGAAGTGGLPAQLRRHHRTVPVRLRHVPGPLRHGGRRLLRVADAERLVQEYQGSDHLPKRHLRQGRHRDAGHQRGARRRADHAQGALSGQHTVHDVPRLVEAVLRDVRRVRLSAGRGLLPPDRLPGRAALHRRAVRGRRHRPGVADPPVRGVEQGAQRGGVHLHGGHARLFLPRQRADAARHHQR